MIRSVLRHRATVVRSVTETDGATSWGTVAESMPCLIDVGTRGQAEASGSQQAADRVGTLFTLANSEVRAGDRVIVQRGLPGLFVVEPDPSTIATLSGPHHLEFRVSEIPGPVPADAELPPYVPPLDLVEIFEANL